MEEPDRTRKAEWKPRGLGWAGAPGWVLAPTLLLEHVASRGLSVRCCSMRGLDQMITPGPPTSRKWLILCAGERFEKQNCVWVLLRPVLKQVTHPGKSLVCG